jgi:hypothetical protein
MAGICDTLDSYQIHDIGFFPDPQSLLCWCIELSLLFSLFASALLGQDVKVSELLSRVQLLCMHHIYSICEPGLDCHNKRCLTD